MSKRDFCPDAVYDVAKKHPLVKACLMEWSMGHLTWEECLALAVVRLAAENEKLFEQAKMEIPAPVIFPPGVHRREAAEGFGVRGEAPPSGKIIPPQGGTGAVNPAIVVESAGVGPGHPKEVCDECGRYIEDKDGRIATVRQRRSRGGLEIVEEYATLCPACYKAAGSSVR